MTQKELAQKLNIDKTNIGRKDCMWNVAQEEKGINK